MNESREPVIIIVPTKANLSKSLPKFVYFEMQREKLESLIRLFTGTWGIS